MTLWCLIAALDVGETQAAQGLACTLTSDSVRLTANRGQSLQNSVACVDVSRHFMSVLQTMWNRTVVSKHVRSVSDKRGMVSEMVASVHVLCVTAQTVHCANGYCCCRVRKGFQQA